jgi:hypothetical protein
MRDRLIARDSLVLAIVSTGAVHQSMPLLLLKAHLFFDHVSLTSKSKAETCACVRAFMLCLAHLGFTF